jgi:hypothetical protein
MIRILVFKIIENNRVVSQTERHALIDHSLESKGLWKKFCFLTRPTNYRFPKVSIGYHATYSRDLS